MASTEAQPDAHDKKKNRVIVAPACPPSVATGYLLLRGATLGVVGASMSEVTVSLMQPTFIKENPVLSGKFTVSLGKKLGCGELQLDESPEGQEKLLNAIEGAANRMIQQAPTLCTTRLSKQEILETYGEHVLDASHKKTKPQDVLNVAFIEDVVLAVPPALPFASTSSLSNIVIERGNLASSITCGKKARKAEVTIKFHVQVNADKEKPESVPAALDDIDVSSLNQAKVRMPEGLVLLEQQQTATQVESVTEAVNDVAMKDAKEEEMVVTAWEVQGKIDYNKLVDQFGSKLLTSDLLERLKKNSKVPLHRFLRREIFFSHRDLSAFLECVEGDVPVYLYTGRGPSSSSMHLGHLIPFLFTKWMQEALDCPLVIQMTDDEKFLFKGEYNEVTGDNLDHYASLTIENARDIIACGFDYNKTFIFSDLEYVGRMYPNIVRIWKGVTTNTVNGIFGFDGSSNIGKVAFPGVQAAPSFASSFPVVLNATRESDMACLIPCAIDQDPYFRMTRDIAHKLVSKSHKLGGKPALIHSKFFPPLQGATGKMSSSDTNSAIFLTDTPEDIERKIKEHAFSGGQDTKKLQEELGADLEVDVAYQWLRFFLEDDKELEKIGNDYSTGSGEYWSTGAVKRKLVEVLQELVREHQERRAKITDEEVRKWMTERCIV
jgi:tryptophanyl-tRNA synthetase